MANGSLVEPLATAQATPPPVEPTTEAPASSPTGELPEEVLKLPAFQALFSGQPPALSASIKGFEKRPEGKLITKNQKPLQEAGIAFYRGLGGDLGVLFNQMYVSPDEIKAADTAGQLAQIAPDFDTVNSEVAKSGKNNPVLSAKGPPAGGRTGPVPAPPQLANVAPQPASAQRATQKARVMNTQIGAPTSGPAPGGGQLLRQILKPVI
jgi:hypothetical protein